MKNDIQSTLTTEDFDHLAGPGAEGGALGDGVFADDGGEFAGSGLDGFDIGDLSVGVDR